jgi:hypothetical protein
VVHDSARLQQLTCQHSNTGMRPVSALMVAKLSNNVRPDLP